jgi:glycosyltransferase involved in cell wall biosynthesis
MSQPKIILDLGGLDQLWPGAGLFRYVVDLLHALRELDSPARFTVFGANPEPIPDLLPVFQGQARHWRYCHFRRSVGLAPEYRNHLRVARALFAHRADLYHCLHTFLPLFAPCPTVVTIQDLMFEMFADYQEAVRSRPYRLFRWGCRQRASRIIAASQSTADDLVRLWNLKPSRIEVVHHGLRVFQAQSALPVAGPVNQALQSLGASPFLCSPFNLEPRKNLITLLEAFAKLPLPFSTACRLVLFGKGGWSEERDNRFRADLQRLGIAERVLLPGVLTDADLWWLYRKSSLFVFPTLYEGFGYPVLEAMAAGACVVVRGVSSMAEVIGEAGVKVEPLTPDTLAETMTALLRDDRRRNHYGQIARQRALGFSSKRMAENTFAVYRKTLRISSPLLAQLS